MAVLTAAGVQSEAQLPFAGLHQLLQPLLVRIGELAVPQREALKAAFGMTDKVAPELVLIALATLETPRRAGRSWSSPTTPSGSTAGAPRSWRSSPGA
jgi:hypothetical protein